MYSFDTIDIFLSDERKYKILLKEMVTVKLLLAVLDCLGLTP